MNPKVLIVIPTLNGVEPECAETVRNQTYSNYSVMTHFISQPKVDPIKQRAQYSNGSTLNRQAARKLALASDADYFWWLDDDVIPPADGLARLILQRKPLLYGWYKMITGKAWVAACWAAEKLVHYRHPQPSVVSCDMAGLGCMLVSRKALEKVDFQHGFDVQVYQADGQRASLGPCGAYSRDCREAGFRPLIADVVCGHKNRRTGVIVG